MVCQEIYLATCPHQLSFSGFLGSLNRDYGVTVERANSGASSQFSVSCRPGSVGCIFSADDSSLSPKVSKESIFITYKASCKGQGLDA